MELVRRVRPDHPGYAVDVTTEPPALIPGQPTRLRLLIRDRETHATVRKFHVTHERVFHLFVISQDLEFFAHLHPEPRNDGALEIELSVPSPGVYQLISDFLPEDGEPQLVQHSLVTAGYAGPLLESRGAKVDVADKVVDRTRVVLTMPEAIAGREQLLTLELQDERSRRPVADLEPYLGAAGHLLLVSHDLQIATHSHPVAQLSPDPATVVFQVLFPRAGLYRLWAQFQRDGTVLTAPFTIAVREPDLTFTTSR